MTSSRSIAAAMRAAGVKPGGRAWPTIQALQSPLAGLRWRPDTRGGWILPTHSRLPFHPAHGQAAAHVLAEGVVDDHRGEGVDDRGRHHQVPRRLVAVEELSQ